MLKHSHKGFFISNFLLITPNNKHLQTALVLLAFLIIELITRCNI